MAGLVNMHIRQSTIQQSCAASERDTAGPGARAGRKSSTAPRGKWSDGQFLLGRPLPATFTAFTGLSACSTAAVGSALDTHIKSIVAQPPGRPYVKGIRNLARIP
jgi:hypothetical protein